MTSCRKRIPLKAGSAMGWPEDFCAFLREATMGSAANHRDANTTAAVMLMAWLPFAERGAQVSKWTVTVLTVGSVASSAHLLKGPGGMFTVVTTELSLPRV